MRGTTILDQFRKEAEEWRKKLQRLQGESIGLKTIIVEKVGPDINKLTLDNVETLHNKLMQKDEMISLLKFDIITFSNMIENESIKDGQMTKLVLMEKKMSTEIETLERRFDQLKADFTQLLSDKL
jgi:translation initiation factor 2 beta subunit (eIF-2beta)/eIF-5